VDDQREPLDIQIAKSMFGPNPSLARIARGPISMHLPAESRADLPPELVLHDMLDHVATRETSR
jgi:hypothetical protein